MKFLNYLNFSVCFHIFNNICIYIFTFNKCLCNFLLSFAALFQFYQISKNTVTFAPQRTNSNIVANTHTHTHTQADTLIHKTLLHSRAKVEERENAAENDQTAKSVDDSLLTHTHTHTDTRLDMPKWRCRLINPWDV